MTENQKYKNVNIFNKEKKNLKMPLFMGLKPLCRFAASPPGGRKTVVLNVISGND
jgi:hypothetical protein